MSEIRVPDIGDFDAVPVIEVHVAVGDTVAAEDPLITLESDKATMDVPAPAAGTVSAATATSLTVTFSTNPAAAGSLTAIVATDSVSSGTAACST